MIITDTPANNTWIDSELDVDLHADADRENQIGDLFMGARILLRQIAALSPAQKIELRESLLGTLPPAVH